MRLRILVLILAFLQTISSFAQAPASLLQRMLAAGGWSQGSLPADALVTATAATLPGGELTGTKTITFKARGVTQFKWEYSDSPGVSTVVDLGSRKARGPAGITPSAQTTQPWILPFLGRLQELPDANTKVELLGTEQLTELAYKLQFRQIPLASNTRADEVLAGSPMTVWISAATFLPIQIEYLEQSMKNRLAFSRRTRRYSDYRNVQGILVPYHQEVWAGDKRLWSLDLTSVKFNVGLDPSEFEFATTVGVR